MMNRSTKREIKKWLLGVGGGLIIGLFFVCGAFGPDIALITYLLFANTTFGWVGFVGRVARHIRPDLACLLTFVTCLLGFGIGFHLTVKWLCSQNRSGVTPWRWRTSLALIGLIVLMVIAGAAVIGIIHQIGWMLNSRESWFRPDLYGRQEDGEPTLP